MPQGLYIWASQEVPVVKNPPANAGDISGMGLIPGSGRYPGGGPGNPLQFSCLENPLDRGAWRATVLAVTHNWSDWAYTQVFIFRWGFCEAERSDGRRTGCAAPQCSARRMDQPEPLCDADSRCDLCADMLLLAESSGPPVESPKPAVAFQLSYNRDQTPAGQGLTWSWTPHHPLPHHLCISLFPYCSPGASLVTQMVKNLPVMQETQVSSWVGKVPWRRECQPMQYSCLENLLDRGAWWAVVAELDMTEPLSLFSLESSTMPGIHTGA